MAEREKRTDGPDAAELMRRKRERIIIVITVVVILILSFLEYHLFRAETILPASSNVLIFGLININVILIILLIFLIVRNVVKLIFERRHGVIGSKLRTRLVAAFVGLSLIPTVALFIVSINFLSYSIDTWFSMKIGDALNQTIEVAQLYYRQTADHAKFNARQISDDITQNRLYQKDRDLYLKTLIEQRQKTFRSDILEVYLDNPKQKFLVKDEDKPDLDAPPLSPKTLEEIFLGKEVSTVNQVGDGDLVSGAAPIYSFSSPQEVIGAVVVSFYLTKALVDKISVISKTSEQYGQLNLLKNPLKFSYIITLFLVTLLIIFSATWFGLFLAKGITGPIQDLADATHKIAQGNLDHQIDVVADDEIGVLVDSFNQMTRDLKKSNQRLEQANIDLEQRRKYMETVLRNVSAGVISIDQKGVIATINRAAEKMLNIRTEKVLAKRYADLLDAEHLALVDQILRELRQNSEGFIEKQIELTIKGSALTFLMATTLISDDEGNDLGMVVVFEDLTQLQKAERAAAWREVARRMAHEIKNPLTPVQLCAQRLQKKFGDRLGEDSDVFRECTNTIISQVDVLKNLVNEFSHYARMPVTTPSLNDLNEVIADAVILYQDAHKEIAFDFQKGEDIPKMNLDPAQIKRVMINLLENAVAAVSKTDGRIEVRTAYESSRHRALVEVSDNGAGIPPAYKGKMFEPYFSTKRSGTGLGLAIVSSIIADHHGHLNVYDNHPHGTVVAFELPVPEV
ncbi:MAG: PAS domain-containing sensor histidine kinase [Deltaproteobacteria bacterium HGW-Deltaproteobacteria-9]|nr:MAG: PAS domain-containing sensor histidine kinase [Deltaproteobacteria bacterium HGW-Deltaproteobacteria-9]